MQNFKSPLLRELSQRKFIKDCTDLDEFDKKLCEKPQKIYIGFDATATSLHVGSLTPLMLLYWIAKTGHIPVILLGGGTSLIGDPSGKDKSRNMLDNSEIKNNIQSLTKIFYKFLIHANGKEIFVNNANWLCNLSYIDFLRKIGTHFTINRMLTFDSVKSRLERESPLSFLEFNYMIMQGYDFYHLCESQNIIAQFGGSDQWGNIVTGVELTRRILGKQVFGLTAPLLVMANGQKMGKSEKGAVWLDEQLYKPYDFWQYWRNCADDEVINFLYKFTTLNEDEIKPYTQMSGHELNQAKIRLAKEVTSFIHGKEVAKEAENTAHELFKKGNFGGDIPCKAIKTNQLDKDGFAFFASLIELGLVKSGGEIKRHIKAGALKVNGQTLQEERNLQKSDIIDQQIKISIGKKKHAVFNVEM